tara:strand:+ start:528 stop:665 length:138 start_codon:yes stop_codon:yes gene_type:complete
MKRVVIISAKKKDHFHLTIAGRYLGMWEKSELRNLVGTVDNTISN